MACVRLARWLARQSLYSQSLQDSFSPTIYESVLKGASRNFGTAIAGQSRVLTDSYATNVNRRNWLSLRLVKANLGGVRSIHGTAYMAAKDFYETHGVSKKTTQSDIKKAYYGQVKKLHPDTNKDDPEAEKKFQEVQKAYENAYDANAAKITKRALLNVT